MLTISGVSISINMAICLASVILSNRFAQSKWAQHPMASMLTSMMMDRFVPDSNMQDMPPPNAGRAEEPSSSSGFEDIVGNLFKSFGNATTAPAMDSTRSRCLIS